MKKIIKILLGYKYTMWVFKGELNNETIYYGIVRPQEDYPNIKYEHPSPRWNSIDGAKWDYTPIFKKNIRRMSDIEKNSPYKLTEWSM